jgi:thioredoxin 1
MAMTHEYSETEPARAEIDALAGAAVVEFGAPWCPICRGAQPLIAEAFGKHGDVPHFKIEDGPGRPLGRSFRVKLWPTLIFLRDGREIARLVRPTGAREISEALAAIASPRA